MTDKLYLPKTPNPLKQARRDKRDARAIKRFILDYRDDLRRDLADGEWAMIHDMLCLASIRAQVANDALAALKADEVKA